jgi:hypothetical protein
MIFVFMIKLFFWFLLRLPEQIIKHHDKIPYGDFYRGEIFPQLPSVMVAGVMHAMVTVAMMTVSRRSVAYRCHAHKTQHDQCDDCLFHSFCF